MLAQARGRQSSASPCSSRPSPCCCSGRTGLVRASMLIEALWGTEPPGSPDAALRVCISRLRRCLGDCATAARQRRAAGRPRSGAPPAARLHDDGASGRAGRRRVHRSCRARSGGARYRQRGCGSRVAIVQALALWGDPPLPDLPDSEVIAAAVARLRNQRQAADRRADRRAAGRRRARAGTRAAPGRGQRDAWPGANVAQLMRAYHALGMRTEALDVYQQARQATLEQQGAEPGPVLAVLYQRILAEELATERPAHRSPGSALAALTLPGSQAPAPPADFTGRSDEIARVVECLSGPGVPVVVLTGGPGMGKSATRIGRRSPAATSVHGRPAVRRARRRRAAPRSAGRPGRDLAEPGRPRSRRPSRRSRPSSHVPVGARRTQGARHRR